MVSTNVLVPCKSCKVKVPVGDLRRNKDGIYVCHNCIGKSYLESSYIEKIVPQTQAKRTEIKPAEKQVKSFIKGGRIPYVCSYCKFSFTLPSSNEARICPYCNREHTVQARGTAQDLLREVDDYL